MHQRHAKLRAAFLHLTQRLPSAPRRRRFHAPRILSGQITGGLCRRPKSHTHSARALPHKYFRPLARRKSRTQRRHSRAFQCGARLLYTRIAKIVAMIVRNSHRPRMNSVQVPKRRRRCRNDLSQSVQHARREPIAVQRSFQIRKSSSHIRKIFLQVPRLAAPAFIALRRQLPSRQEVAANRHSCRNRLPRRAFPQDQICMIH